MWNRDSRYPGEEILVDPEGQVHRLRPIQKKWKIKYASNTNKPTVMDLSQKAGKLSLLQTMFRGIETLSFENRQTHQTKAASSPDKIMVDFHTDATYSDRIPKHVSIVTDSNRKDFMLQETQKRQKKEDESFKREVEAIRAAKRLRVLQDSYRNRGIVI